MKDFDQKKAAKEFAERWKDKGYEKGESQKYWIDLLSNVLGVEDPIGFIEFEDTVSCTADQVYEKYGLSMFNNREIKFENYK